MTNRMCTVTYSTGGGASGRQSCGPPYLVPAGSDGGHLQYSTLCTSNYSTVMFCFCNHARIYTHRLKQGGKEEEHRHTLISDHLDACEPIVATLEDLSTIADANGIHIAVYELSPLQPGETLQAHVQREVQLHGTACSEPHLQVR